MAADRTPGQAQRGVAEWENEGGQLVAPVEPALAEGVVAVTETHYLVGAYRYSRLADALAEHRRRSALPGSV